MQAEYVFFFFAYQSIHISTNDWNDVFGNVPDKGRLLVVKGDDVHFITVIGGTVASAFIILSWILSMLFSDFKTLVVCCLGFIVDYLTPNSVYMYMHSTKDF